MNSSMKLGTAQHSASHDAGQDTVKKDVAKQDSDSETRGLNSQKGC